MFDKLDGLIMFNVLDILVIFNVLNGLLGITRLCCQPSTLIQGRKV